MILGTGIDIVEINRFNTWHTYSQSKLKKIFSDAEIAYCLSSPLKSAERFAARFAAKEALYKAWVHAFKEKVPFLTLCKNASIVHADLGFPIIADTTWFTSRIQYNITFHITISHTDNLAIAQVLIEKI